jgi:GNAT superfamily N-acetyltransferase
MQIARYFEHLFHRLRNEPVSQLMLDGLGRLGLQLQPFYLFEEALPSGGVPAVDPELRNASIRLLEPGQIGLVTAMPWRGLDEATCAERLARGNGCLGLFIGERLAAFTWFDLEECNFEGWRMPLRPDEAYLFDAFTLTEWRGKGLAPYLRYRVYERLGQEGRNRFLSVSIRANRAAIRFKRKLGGRIIGRGFRVVLFGRWSFGSKPPKRRG